MPDSITQIRRFNRFYTNVLGLLNQSILDSGYSLTEARILYEIGKTNPCSANQLSARLNIDRGYMSRVLKDFARKGLITRGISQKDSRIYEIRLTRAGMEAARNLNRKSEEQLAKLTAPLDETAMMELTRAMTVIQSKLSDALQKASIRDFTLEDIPYVIAQHQALYAEEYGLSPVFEAYVEKSVRQFAQKFDGEKECMLIAEQDGRPVGSIAIVRAGEDIAQLRYFLLEPEARGQGLGNALVVRALAFCRQKGYRSVFLETISVLEAARHIYAKNGFVRTHTHENMEWGSGVTEERWELALSI